MKFKRNPTATIACVVNECLLSLIPAIVIVYVFFIPNQINELLSTLVIIPYFAFILNVVLIFISLISGIFIKTKYCIGKEALTVEQRDNVKEIKYDEIASITYDYGNVFSQFNRTPSQLVLFAKDGKRLLTVKNPSITMTHVIRKKCKHSEVCFEHNNRILFFLSLINGIVLLTGVLIKIFQ